MHKGLSGFVRAATARAIVTHINTNGSYLNEQLAAVLVAAGLSSIKFSFQGVDRASYREARNIDYFGRLVDRVAMMKRIRGKRAQPWIAVSTSTTYESDDQIKRFRTLFAPYADEISVGKTVMGFFDSNAVRLDSEPERRAFDRLTSAAATDLAHPDPCPEVWDKLSVSWDGSVRVCCNDYDGVTSLGNVNDTELDRIWQHSVIRRYRDRLARGEYSGPLCSVCFDYMPKGADA